MDRFDSDTKEIIVEKENEEGVEVDEIIEDSIDNESQCSKFTLNTFDSYSLDSFESLDYESDNDENEIARQPNIADHVINTFIVKRRRLLMDDDNHSQYLLTYEESEQRIILILQCFALILLISCSLLLSQAQPSTKYFTTKLVQQTDFKYRNLSPNIAIVKSDGTLQSYKFVTNYAMMETWNITLPSSNEYYPYYDQNMLYIIYADSKKPMTQIDVGNTKLHRTLKNSKNLFLKTNQFVSKGKLVRVGNYLILFGGYLKTIKTNSNSEPYNSELNIVNRNAFVWSIKKQKWLNYFQIDKYYGGNMCGVSINDTIAVFFGHHQKPLHYNWPVLAPRLGYLAKFVLNVKNGHWIEKDGFFHDLHDIEYFESNLDLACDSIVSKNLEL